MSRLIDLTGQKFERLIVVKYAGKKQSGAALWLCVCDCGKERVICSYSLRSGNTKSCGCLQKEIVSAYQMKHGHSTRTHGISKVYGTWRRMIQRCNNFEHPYYVNYGKRGITICERWMDFENFLEDMGEPPTQEHSIDRIDNDGNYCKSNCRWATKKEQARNTRRNLLITFDGETQCLMWWAEKFNINYHTLHNRIYRSGWPIEKALITPIQKRSVV